jgi:hypothetical protein
MDSLNTETAQRETAVPLTFEEVKNNEEISAYIRKGNDGLGAIGYTEHGFAHATKTATKAAEILAAFDHPKRMQELAMIAAYLHDIGNCVNRNDHAQSGAIMAFRILDKLGMDPAELAEVVEAIGNHDEGTGTAVSPISAAVILADKSDVRRTRVRYKNRNRAKLSQDIHDRVNFAVQKADLQIEKNSKKVILELTIDTKISAVMEYFEIFLVRMSMCRQAALFLGADFQLNINGVKLL